MGPGILFKAILQSGFSLMVFGWTQIVMDLQPLMVLITGAGQLHGFTHTFIGAVLIAAVAALSGKYLSELGLRLLKIKGYDSVSIKWWVAFISAIIGAFSHVFLDGIMHSDVQPFYPLSLDNVFWQWVSIDALHKYCLYSGIIGGLIYFLFQWHASLRKQQN